MGVTRDIETLARTIYGEARGESFEGQVAVAWVIMNRYKAQKKRWGYTIEEVCMKPWQFSCWNENDPNRGRILAATFVDRAYIKAYGIACLVSTEALPDPTRGADHYHTHTILPNWADEMQRMAVIGHHIFYREA